jgi:type VI secretion system protein ImpF
LRQGQENIQASILDRLIDDEPEVSYEPVQHRLLDIRQIKNAVARDLENLLNTRRNIVPVPSEYKELNKSLFVYGLRDFTSKDPRSPTVKQQLRRDIEKAISQFDNRLRNITVQLETASENDRIIRFRITGLLVIEPVNEPIVFDTYFDINRGEYVISK